MLSIVEAWWVGLFSTIKLSVIARRNDVAIPYLQNGPANWGLPRYARNDVEVITPYAVARLKPSDHYYPASGRRKKQGYV
ncbi:hypothetical protein FHW89_004221 [Mucilaginibacter sp. SG564]|nr:hypothetical protein [Mucilaginibacter sp. SG564]